MVNFRFTNEHSSANLGNVAGLLTQRRLWIPTQADYPGHGEWVQKAEAQLAQDEKRAMLAYDGLKPVGIVVYQRHPTRPDTVEIKNLSVAPDARGGFVGSFLLRITEVEALKVDFPGCRTIVGDVKVTNTEMVGFLIKHGYTPEEITDLYKLGAGLDVVFSKTLAE